MSLQQRITAILQKLTDPDCVSLAEKEIKNLIISEIDDGEKLNVLIGCIGDDRDTFSQKNRKSRYNQLKFFISIAEIFQHQILEFLPRVFQILNKKIKDGDQDIADIIADTYGGITLFAYKGAEEQDANYVFAESINQLIEVFERGGKIVQNTSALCVMKIVQNCQIEILKVHFENLYGALARVLSVQSSVKSPLHLLECILSLILSVQEKVGLVVATLPPILMKFIAEEDPKTRKICIDIFYSIMVINKDLLRDIEGSIYEMLQGCKSDKNKSVRETAVECLKYVKPGPMASKKNPPSKETPKETGHSKKPSSNQVDSQNQSKNRISSNRKLGIINQKLDLEHVHSTIDKTKINRQFLKNIEQQQDDTVILYKEPKIKIPRERPVEEANRRSPSPSPNRSPINEKADISLQTHNDVVEIGMSPRGTQPESNTFTFNNKAADQPEDTFISYQNTPAYGAIQEEPINPQYRGHVQTHVTETPGKKLVSAPIQTPHQKTSPQILPNPLSAQQQYSNQFFKQNPMAIERNENLMMNLQQPFAQPDINGSETAFLKNYVNQLNNRISDFQGVIINLQNTNTQLTSRIFNLEKEIYELRGFVRESSLRGNIHQPPAFNNFIQGPEQRGRGFEDQGYKQGQFSFGEHQLVEANRFRHEFDPSMDLNSYGNNNNQQNRWLTKSTASVNETLFEILALPNPAVQEAQLVAFLRTHSNLKLFSSIDQTLLDKLFDKILNVISKNSNQNLILVEYAMRWIEKYVTFNKINDPSMVKRLYNVLVWTQNQFDDEVLSVKINGILDNSLFRIMRRTDQEGRGGSTMSDRRNPSKRGFSDNDFAHDEIQGTSRTRTFNVEHLMLPGDVGRDAYGSPTNFESEVIDLNDRFKQRPDMANDF
jgi:hypothetical protein